MEQGDVETGRHLHEESLALRRAMGDRWGTAIALLDLGQVAPCSTGPIGGSVIELRPIVPP
jgi:hypothetical protein